MALAPCPANAAVAFAPLARGDASPQVVHVKQRLVPLVERVGPRWLDLSLGGRGGFEAGGSLTTRDGRIGRFGALVCYELTFPELARKLRTAGATTLVVVSNDAWLGRTTAVQQHFAHAVLRAVENRMTVVRSSNAGISGVVDPLGRVVSSTEPFVEGVAVGDLQQAAVAPLSAGVAGLTGPACLALLAFLLLGVGRRSSRALSAPRHPRDHHQGRSAGQVGRVSARVALALRHDREREAALEEDAMA